MNRNQPPSDSRIRVHGGRRSQQRRQSFHLRQVGPLNSTLLTPYSTGVISPAQIPTVVFGFFTAIFVRFANGYTCTSY